MTGRERLVSALRCQHVDRVPWVPFVGAHGASLIGMSASEYLRSADRIVQGVSRAIELYEPDGIPVVFDLQIEAEALGCQLNWADENPPAVISHPLAEGVALSDLSVPAPDAGRIGVALDATGRIREQNPDLAVYGLITGPFTLALHLLGTDIFMKMFDAPHELEDLLAFTGQVATALADYHVQAGCDVVAVVDPMTSQIGPDPFRQYVSPHARALFQHIRDAGALSSFFVCGHAQQNIQAMCETRPDNVSVDENIPLDFVRDICHAESVSFGGNLQLTTVLQLGTADDARRNAIECLEIAGEKGFVLAPGCDLPYATPPENLQAVGEVVRDEYQRQVARTLAVDEAACPMLDLKDYGQADKIIVDVITLDSEACAPCQYMVEAVRKVAPEFEGIVEWREHKIKYRESLAFMTGLMVRNIPTICIDGKISFVSRIPAREELIEAIQQRIYDKMRSRIRQRRATVYILGQPDDEKTRQLRENVGKAITELGVEVDIEDVTDEQAMFRFGVTRHQTPAALVAHYQLRSTRSVPDVPIIREWLKGL